MISINIFKQEYIEIEFNENKDNIKELIDTLKKYKDKYKICYISLNIYEPKKPFYIKLALKEQKK